MSELPVSTVELPSFEFSVRGRVELVTGAEPLLVVTVEIPPYQVVEKFRGLKIAACEVDAQSRRVEIPITSAAPDFDEKDWELKLAARLSDQLAKRILNDGLKDGLKLPKEPWRPNETKSQFVLKCARQLWQWDEAAKKARFVEMAPLDLVEAAGFFDQSNLINRCKLHGIESHEDLLKLARLCGIPGSLSKPW